MGVKVRYKKPDFLSKAKFGLWQDYHKWQRTINEKLQKIGLNYLQAILIMSIQWHSDLDSKITQVQIANTLSIDPMLASLSIRALEKNGWLIRKTHPNDTRAKSLHLTAKTHQHLKGIQTILTKQL